MIETTPARDDEHVSEVVHIKPPWFFTPMACITGVLLAATLLLFGVGQWQNGREVRHAAEDARQSAEEAKGQSQDLKMQVSKLTHQIECRSQRGSDLNAITSDEVGGLVDMVNLLSDHAPPEAYAPLKAQLKALGDARALAKQQAVTAVQDC